jgi:hypothetical protein
MLKLTPSASGPSVNAAQYTSTRWPSGRGLRTRQMLFSVRSIVSTNDSAVATSSSRPAVPNWLALPANCVKARSTGLAILSGTRFCKKYLSSALSNPANIGKAVNTASITVTSGTKAIKVVKVRLLAVTPKRSSRKRWRNVRTVSNQGQVRSRAKPVVARSPRLTLRGVREFIVLMMPA